MDSLPDTTIAEIIYHLSFKDKANVRLVNHRWKRSAEVVLRKVNLLFVHGLFPYESPCEKDSLRFTPYVRGNKEKLLCTRAKLPSLLVAFVRKYCPSLSVLITTLSISWDDLITIGRQLHFFACCAILDTPPESPIDFREVFTNLHDFVISFKKFPSFCPSRMIQSGVPLVTLESSLHSLQCESCQTLSYHNAIFGTMFVDSQLAPIIEKLSLQLRHIRCFTNEFLGPSNGFSLPNLESLHLYSWIAHLPRYLVNSPDLKQLVVSPSSQFMTPSDAKQFVNCLRNLKQLRYLEVLYRDTSIRHEETVILPLGETYLTKFKYHSPKFSCFLVAANSFYGGDIKVYLCKEFSNQLVNASQQNPLQSWNNLPLCDFSNSSLRQIDFKFDGKVDWSDLISRLATVRNLKSFSICFKDLIRIPSPSFLPSMIHMDQLTEMHIICTSRAMSYAHSSRVRPFKMISLPPNVESFTWSTPYSHITSLLNPTFANSLRVLVLSVTTEIPFKLWFPQLTELYLTIPQSFTCKPSYSLDFMVNLTQVTHLYINYCLSEYVEKVSSIISKFSHLKKLALTESVVLADNSIVTSPTLPSHEMAINLHRLTTQIVTYCKSLETFITNASLTDDCFLMLSSARKLSHLQVKMTQEQVTIFFAHLPIDRLEKNILIANQRFITLPAAVSKIFTMQTYSVNQAPVDMQSTLHDKLLLALLSKKITRFSFVPDLRCTCGNVNCVLKN